MPWIKIVILVLFLIPRVLPAQEIVLKGRVSDPQGNALPNAWVQLIGQNQVLAHAMSKPDGQFLMNVRSAGEFVVKASAPGFRPVIREITVRSSANSLIEIEMSQLPSRNENITVTPLTIFDLLGTIQRLPFRLQVRGEFEYVGTKLLGTGCNPANLNSDCTGTPVKEFRGAVVRPFLNGRMDAGVNFRIASGYSGQTTENFYPSQIQQVVGVRIPSYASVTVTYRFGRQPAPSASDFLFWKRGHMMSSTEQRMAFAPKNKAAVNELDVLWITAGLGCDGDTIAMTAATQPSIEDVLLGQIPWIPKVTLHNPFLALANGDDFMKPFHQAAAGKMENFILVVEGSIPNEHNKEEGYWASLGTDPKTGQPITTCEWIDRLAPNAWAVVAAGTCATYGGIHAMEGNPTGCMGLPDYLGWKWKSKAEIPIVCVPGCPVQPDNFMETLLYLLYMASGRAPMIPLDEALRPTWLFGNTVHEGCDRGGFYEQAQFADEYGSPLCIVKLGCWGPVVQCNVGKRGWMGGIGGCPNVGGICIGCTMPGFPDKFMPFMNQPPGSLLSSAAVQTYGRAIHALRRFTQSSLNKEPSWRKPTR